MCNRTFRCRTRNRLSEPKAYCTSARELPVVSWPDAALVSVQDQQHRKRDATRPIVPLRCEGQNLAKGMSEVDAYDRCRLSGATRPFMTRAATPPLGQRLWP